MPSHSLCLRTSLALAIAIVACDDKSDSSAAAPAATKYAPALTAELVPPALRGAVVGHSTDAEVTKAFGAGTLLTDKSLGGTGKVSYTDAPAMRLTLTPSDDILRGEAWFVPDASKTPRLQHIEIVTKTTDACKWIETNVGAKEGSTKRPGSNRKFGAHGDGNSYTAGTPDGASAVGIECNPSQKDGVAVQTIVYSVEGSGGRSMMAQEG